MKRLSIGLRLTLWYLAIFFIGELLFGGGMWFILRKNLNDIADATLEGQAADLQRFFAVHSGTPEMELQKEISEDYRIEHSQDYLQIYTPDGSFFYRSRYFIENPLPQIAVDRLAGPHYQNRKLGRNRFRILSEKMELGGHVFVTQIASNLDEENETLAAFRAYLLIFVPVLLLGASAAGYWLSHRALAPVEALARTARTISGENLGRRLEQLHTGDELQRLSDTLNEMLGRIESAFLRVTEFTADASHELRTPIALIQTEAELALRRSRSEAEYKEALRHILHEAQRTAKLLEELLALARADSGRAALDLRPIDLLGTWQESAAKWNQVAALRNLQFEETLHARHLYVRGDANALRRVIDILLDNAFKYTPSPGKVMLSAEEKDGRAVVSVEDTGVGIAADDQARIFERFYRVDKARSRELGGAGLGLAIARWITQLHSGFITVRSELGKGALFRLEIPLTTSVLDQNPSLLKPETRT